MFYSILNTPPLCPASVLHFGEILIEWLENEVPLEDLNSSVNRFPIRTDVLPGTYTLLPRANVALEFPLPPPANAGFAVIRVAVDDDPDLIDPTVDYLQFPSPLPEPGGLASAIAGVAALFGLAAVRRAR